MNPRLLILLVLAVVLAIFFAAVKGKPKSDVQIVDVNASQGDDRMKTLDQLPLPGSEPPEEPDLSVQVEVDRSKGKNRLYFTISEAHGYYVEQFNVLFWYVRDGKTEPDDSPLVLNQRFERFLPANENLRVCLEVVPAELEMVGGDIGETKDWKAEIEWHGRAREKNPDPLPLRNDLGSCD